MFGWSLRRQPPRHATCDARSRARGTGPEPTRNRPRVQIGGALPRLADSGSPLGSLLGGSGQERPALECRNHRGGVEDPSEAPGGVEIDLVTVNRGRCGGDHHPATAGPLGQGEAADSKRVYDRGVEGVSRGHLRPLGGAVLIEFRGQAVVAALRWRQRAPSSTSSRRARPLCMGSHEPSSAAWGAAGATPAAAQSRAAIGLRPTFVWGGFDDSGAPLQRCGPRAIAARAGDSTAIVRVARDAGSRGRASSYRLGVEAGSVSLALEVLMDCRLCTTVQGVCRARTFPHRRDAVLP